MDFDEREDQEEEMEEEEEEEEEAEAAAARQSYDSLGNSSRQRLGPVPGEGARKFPPTTRYRECLKNHALSVGGHAVDGCGEFMPAGEEGTLDALKCAACNCHRNFHRKETDSHHQQQHSQLPSYYRPPPPAGYLNMTLPPSHHRPLALPSASGGGGYNVEEEDVSNPSSSGGGRKRFRTKFTAEQKEKMREFAEAVGWRIRREEEAAVERFCEEMGLTRQVLKVWMHNNKNTLGKKP